MIVSEPCRTTAARFLGRYSYKGIAMTKSAIHYDSQDKEFAAEQLGHYLSCILGSVRERVDTY